MMEQGNKTLIGHIYANIAGDVRYGSVVDVMLCGGGSVEVYSYEYAPRGGMDSCSGPCRVNECRDVIPALKVTPAAVMRSIKHSLREDIIRRYGKPMKRFEWHQPDTVRPVMGLSIAKCKATLEAWSKTDPLTRPR